MSTSTKPVRANHATTPGLILARTPFVATNVRGTTDRVGPFDSGWLTGPDKDRFYADMASITFCVFSFATPIAWYRPDTGWYKVGQKFSPTTSKHQGRLYLI